MGADDNSGHFIDYLLERPDVAPVWHQFVNHPFVLAMGDATLPLESFKGYLIQDYLYLVHFARANALASYKAKSLEDITAVSLRLGIWLGQLGEEVNRWTVGCDCGTHSQGDEAAHGLLQGVWDIRRGD